ncbi:MAG: amidohydrolase family protein [Phenylobacterium sp.]|uniref:amidohydrolase family protein n=1 Tax=Phenylobacterium sp. TaxID=1871053 RepID=UPI00273679D7|nr:amidohydrolase family protein [Phenylobacterium sp.]MDP3175639.1 amidohydrolase family protein [Phenylobacterium sp.]
MEDVIEPDLAICDPHHHLWDFPTNRYLLHEFLADVGDGHRVESTVYVECGSFYRAEGPDHLKPVGETEFAAGQAAMSASDRYGPARVALGIVGYADLTGDKVQETLSAHVEADPRRFRGVRHITAWDASDKIHGHGVVTSQMLAQPAFRAGVAALGQLGLSFDAYVYHPQIDEVTALATALPDQTIVLDHVGGVVGIGPYAGKRDEIFPVWRAAIQELAKRPNVNVKLGGLGMTLCGFGFHKLSEPASSQVLADAWRPYIEACIEAFGAERAMFESNYPMDSPSCTYRTLWNAFKRLAQGASADEKAALFKGTAERVYRL